MRTKGKSKNYQYDKKQKRTFYIQCIAHFFFIINQILIQMLKEKPYRMVQNVR